MRSQPAQWFALELEAYKSRANGNQGPRVRREGKRNISIIKKFGKSLLRSHWRK